MEEKIIQIIPAPANLMYSYGGEDANHVVCLALVESEDGDREIRAMGLTNLETIEDVGSTAVFFSNTNP